MSDGNFALWLEPSLMDEARRVARSEGVTLNQFINVAVADKLSVMRTRSYFAERAARASIARAVSVLDRAGRSNPPMAGDEFPD